MSKKARSSLSYLISAARKIWRWTPERKAVIERCRYFDKWKCEKCSGVVSSIKKRGKEVMPIQVDHRIPIGPQPKTWAEVGGWLEKLFCGIENLWGICLACHKRKTTAEVSERAAKRKAVSKKKIA